MSQALALSNTGADTQMNIVGNANTYYFGSDHSVNDRLTLGKGTTVGTTPLMRWNSAGQSAGSVLYHPVTIPFFAQTSTNSADAQYIGLYFTGGTYTITGGAATPATRPTSSIGIEAMVIANANATAFALDNANGIDIVAPNPDNNVTISDTAAIRIQTNAADAGGTATRSSAIKIDAQAGSASAYYGIQFVESIAGGNIYGKNSGLNFATGSGDIDLNPAADIDCNSNDLTNVGASGNDWTSYRLFLSNSRSGANMDIISYNSANDDGDSHAILHAKTGGTNGGDPQIRLEVAGDQEVRMGLDNSTGADNFVISDSGALGTNDRLRMITTTGAISIDADSTIGGDATIGLFDDYDDVAEIRRFQLAILDAPISVAERDYNRQRLVDIGVGEWAVQSSGPDHWMMCLQPMTRLLAGGIYQTREKVYELEERLVALEARGG